MADNRGSIQFQAVERPKMASHDSTVLDLAFAMDCTSSMSSYIREAQQVGGNSNCYLVSGIGRRQLLPELVWE